MVIAMRRHFGHCPPTILTILLVIELAAGICSCQLQAGVYDFGQGRFGEKRGSWTPGEWLAGMLLLMTIFMGLAISIGLCYYVNKRQTQKSSSRLNYIKRQQLQADISIQRKAEEAATEVEEIGGGEEAPRGKATTRGASGRQATDLISERGATDWPDHRDQRHRQQQQWTPNALLAVQI